MATDSLGAPLPGARPGWGPVALVLASMSSVQLGVALSVTAFATAGVGGTTWLRVSIAAAVLIAAVRPWPLGRADLAAGLLGLVTAGNAFAFSAATDRIPLGVTVAVEFCGPLVVAVLAGRGHPVRRVAVPVAALGGVVLLTRPWTIGDVTAARTWTGLGFAAAAGLGWALYIVLTAHVGRRREGFGGLAVALGTAAVVLAPAGAGQAWPVLRSAVRGGSGLPVVGVCVLAALFVPLAAYLLEVSALRRLDQGVFGTWMALEPAIGALVGLLLLGQHLAPGQLPGVALVVAAGIAAHRAAPHPV